MAAENFAKALAHVLKHEGGYVDHPRDPGGATNLGVTIGTLSQVLGRPATKAEVKALTRKTVAPIYRQLYWDKIRGDDLPSGVDFAVFDFAVNSGPHRAAIALQRVVGVADDGKIGPITLAAARKLSADVVVSRVCAARLAFLTQLSTWPVFGKGWETRVAVVKRQSRAMIAAPETQVA